MVPNGLDRYSPLLDGMALLALGAKLPAMEICMAVRTFRTHVFEHRLDVARPAFHLLVRTAQWIARLIVVEVGNGADGFPTGVGVTTLAGNCQRTVRILCRVSFCRLARRDAARQEQNPN